jgi:hypothetical protein
MDSIPVPASLAEAIERYRLVLTLMDCSEETAALLVVASLLLEGSSFEGAT